MIFGINRISDDAVITFDGVQTLESVMQAIGL